MSLRSLALLVLAVVLGTAASVNWYLRADDEAPAAQEAVAPVRSLEHVPLPMRAEPARLPTAGTPTQGYASVASKGQGHPRRSYAAPAGSGAAIGGEAAPAAPMPASPGAFQGPPDPL